MRLAVVAVVVGLTGTSFAQAPGMTDPIPAGPSYCSLPPQPIEQPGLAPYHNQLMLADGIAIGLVAAAIANDGDGSEQLATAGLVTYGLGAPIVHLSKNRGGRALGSLALRIGLPYLGAMLGGTQSQTVCEFDTCEIDNTENAALGALVGAVGAMIIDDYYLGRGEPAPRGATWAPTAGATRNGFAVGVAATF